jgi:hypothetical protein
MYSKNCQAGTFTAANAGVSIPAVDPDIAAAPVSG